MKTAFCRMSTVLVRPRRVLTGVLVAGIAAAGSTLGGCVGYNVYPPMEGERGFTNVNSDPFPPIMTESLKWVTLRYPPNAAAEWSQPAAGNVGITPFAVNLPRGINRMLGERIIQNVGNGAQPMIPGNEELPIYHISRIWVTGDEAKVDIIRPVTNVAFTKQGQSVTQGITVRLRGGMSPWRVTSHRVWSFNALQPPAINYLQGTVFDVQGDVQGGGGSAVESGTEPANQAPQAPSEPQQ